MGERISYSQGVVDTKDCFDLYINEKSEKCYNSIMSAGLYQTHFSFILKNLSILFSWLIVMIA